MLVAVDDHALDAAGRAERAAPEREAKPHRVASRPCGAARLVGRDRDEDLRPRHLDVNHGEPIRDVHLERHGDAQGRGQALGEVCDGEARRPLAALLGALREEGGRLVGRAEGVEPVDGAEDPRDAVVERSDVGGCGAVHGRGLVVQIIGEVEQELRGEHAVIVRVGELVGGVEPPVAAALQHLRLDARGAAPPEQPGALHERAEVGWGVSVADEVREARDDVGAAQDEVVELLVGVALGRGRGGCLFRVRYSCAVGGGGRRRSRRLSAFVLGLRLCRGHCLAFCRRCGGRRERDQVPALLCGKALTRPTYERAEDKGERRRSAGCGRDQRGDR